MSPTATIIVWVALAIFALLFVLAVAHVIQGYRFAHGDWQVSVATLVLVLASTVIIGTAATFLRSVDWHLAWSFSHPPANMDDSL